MNRFDAVACSFVGYGRNAYRLPEGALVVEMFQGDVVATNFYNPTECHVAHSVSRSINDATIDDPVITIIPAESLEAAKQIAEDLAVREMESLLGQ